MKRFLGLIGMALVALLPFAVSAKIQISTGENCKTTNEDGSVTCTMLYEITDKQETSLVVTLTEKGGAAITEIKNANDTDWTVADTEEKNNVWTVTLTSPGVKGEGELFTFTYTPSGEDDCKVVPSLANGTVVTPEEDKPTDNKDTGATLPYVALGAIALVAVGAYVATKNKSKMYKI